MSSIPPPVDSPPDSEQAYRRRVAPSGWHNPVPKPLYDLAVIGAGPAGRAAVEEAVRHGRSVALVEREFLGGNSLNTGSIPSKAVIRAASRAAPDFRLVMARMRRIRARIAEYSSVDRLRAQGVDVYFGAARFTSATCLLAAGAPLRFKKAIVASGARPRPSNIPGLDQLGYFTSESIFDIDALPRRLGIIGGGPLGCELAQMFCRLGSQVTIVQNEPKFLPKEERDAAELLSLALSRDGVETRLNTTVVGARGDGAEKFLDTVNADVRCSLSVDAILLCIGRVPNVENLGLDAAGIATGPEGGVTVDPFLCTTNPDVYAAGDVCETDKFANIAEASARVAVANAFGGTAPRRSALTVPWCTYCDPEIAHIGMNIGEAHRRGIAVRSFTIMMQDVDRAITDGEDDGFVKIYVRDGSDDILGATIVASRASEMINEMSVIMSAAIGMRRLATILHSYPTQSDAIRMAALAYVRDEPPTPWPLAGPPHQKEVTHD